MTSSSRLKNADGKLEKGMEEEEEDGESNCFVAGDHWGRRGKKKDESVC